jgi:hypothetical protein
MGRDSGGLQSRELTLLNPQPIYKFKPFIYQFPE